MLLYITVFAITFIIAHCFNKYNDKFATAMLSIVVAVIVTILSNVTFFGINYHTIPTTLATKSYTDVVIDSTKMYDKNVLCSYNDGDRLYYNDDNVTVVNNEDNNNELIINREKFALSKHLKLWFCNYSFPSKSNKTILKLNKKDYELYQSYKNHVEKGNNTL